MLGPERPFGYTAAVLRLWLASALALSPASAFAQSASELADPSTGESPSPERGEPPPSSGEAQESLQTEPARPRLLVVDAASFGIDPVVGRVTSARMRLTGEEMGYEVLTPEQSVAAAQELRMPYPPTPADLWRVCWLARAQRGAFARVWAHAGRYVVEITVASLDGAGPFFARGTAGADDLRDVVDRLLRTALPPPALVAAIPEAMGPEAGGGLGPTEGGAIDELDGGRTEPPRGRVRAPEPEPELRRFSLAVQTEGAIGIAEQVFYNHLAGARFDVRITPSILVGVYVAWANLSGREGRADNILFMAQFENRIRISPEVDVTIPLRAGVGYLPFNGPVIRLAGGVNYAISPDWEIAADLLVPTFWILPDRTAISLDLSLEVAYRF